MILLPLVEAAGIVEAFERIQFQIGDERGDEVLLNAVEPAVLCLEKRLPVAVARSSVPPWERVKELEAENARLKKLVANQALDIDMLKEISAEVRYRVACGYELPRPGLLRRDR